ncbi:MAG TPA: flagellar motor protein MotB [Desulfomonilia bacterium]|nr:flagellar motor protein MotB [Desulfomonilia bacterium]
MSDGKEQSIIIKKYKKKGDEGHGGSWKVAYADFVTAMMAFFLLLWLLSMTSQQKKIALSQYFLNYSIFERGGGSAVAPIPDVTGKAIFQVGKGATKSQSPSTMVVSDLANKINKEVGEKLKEFQDRVLVFDDNGNLRIEIIDTGGTSFFNVGGIELSETGKSVIKGIAPALKGLDKKIIIEGHTDSLGYKGLNFTNWELSTQRAAAARVELEKNGIPPNQIEMVAGYADTKPFIRNNPSDPKNRRISLVVDFKTSKNQLPPEQALKKPKLPDSPPGLQ